MGRSTTRTDQRGVVITYHYNDRRQVESETADFGSLVAGQSTFIDQGVQAITRAYDNLGRVTDIASHSTAQTTHNTTNVENEIKYNYRTDGLVDTSWQAHGGEVVTSGGGESPHVEYGYDVSVSSNVYTNGLRQTSERMPGGRNIVLNYASGGTRGDRLNQVDALTFQGIPNEGTHVALPL